MRIIPTLLRVMLPVLMLCASQGAWAASATRTDVQIAQGSEQVQVFFDAPVALSNHFFLNHPPRLVIDMPALASGSGVGLGDSYRGVLLRDIRFGRPDPQTSRIVLDLTGGVANPNVYIASNPHRLVVDMPVAGHQVSQPQTQSDSRPQVTGYVPTPTPKPQAVAAEARKPVIVIDAGHGGKDVGAIGKSGIQEKAITLDYAQSLRHALLKTGKYQVVLTRDGDEYLFLGERVNLARKQKGDVFISLHADSNPNPSAVGLSIYTISEEASDSETAALAAQENKADIIGGIDLSVEDKTVANILIDLAQRETRNKGSSLADTLIEHMHPKIPLLTNTHRHAGFKVLKAPDIPSVLIEVGFLSNRQDEGRIQSREYKDKVVRSIVLGLNAYLGQ